MNVVFFLVDDLGWSDIGCYGSRFYETPNIDNFAKESVRFTSAYAACHVNSPSRASILTGKYPASLNLTDWLPGRRDFPFQKLLNVPVSRHLPYDGTTIAKELQGQSYVLEGDGDDDSIDRKDVQSHEGYRIFPDRTVKIKQLQDNVEFAAMVESMDESFGRALEELKVLGIDDRTIVIFYSDNGGMSAANFYDPNRVIRENELDKAYSTSNLPLRGGKGWLYEGGIRVPLIIKWPGKGLRNVICDVPVTGPDFFPTILDMSGIQMKPWVKSDGVSFAPLLRGETKIDRDAIFWHFPHYSNHGMQSPGGAVRCGDYKLLEYYENNTVQLFNLKNDKEERHDLASSEPEMANKLREMLHNRRKQVNAKTMELNPEYKVVK
ncbi:MAG: sulfatase [Tannerella sp.]|nr:sulfatase [Tannerella sp.]